MVIKGIESGYGIGQAFPATAKNQPASAAGGFGKVIGELVDTVNNTQLSADKAIQNLVTGESQGLHEVMIAMEKSTISLQFLTQVRNKAVEAYQEVMRMQV